MLIFSLVPAWGWLCRFRLQDCKCKIWNNNKSYYRLSSPAVYQCHGSVVFFGYFLFYLRVDLCLSFSRPFWLPFVSPVSDQLFLCFCVTLSSSSTSPSCVFLNLVLDFASFCFLSFERPRLSNLKLAPPSPAAPMIIIQRYNKCFFFWREALWCFEYLYFRFLSLLGYTPELYIYSIWILHSPPLCVKPHFHKYSGSHFLFDNIDQVMWPTYMRSFIYIFHVQ